ncbi:MAG: carboxypeptidase regulatory-like domain-containing protein [Bacteroidetes bacterium]|nr:carboxypeptidase regulatory-like domain-containing protein [Bacteroidota bacterium]
MSDRFITKLAVFFCLVLLMYACKKNPDTNVNVTEPDFAIPASTPVNGSVSGKIVDENNQPVSNAIITCGNISTVSDVNGLFNINNITLDKYISTAVVKRQGYFDGYRSFCANEGRNLLYIKLVPKNLSGTVSSVDGGIISLSNGTSINFQPNSFIVKRSGSPYSGTVNVYASYIDPTTDDIHAMVPGSFMAKDDRNMYVLSSTGMLAVNIQSPSGEELQLATGLPSTVHLPIPNSLLSKAPSTIDTWSLDDKGIWVKENTANKAGDHYEFQASHFSFWNCDVPNSTVYLSIHLQDQHNIALPNTQILLTAVTGSQIWGATSGITDVSGNVSGLVPAGVEFEVGIRPNNALCSDYMTLPSIGPFSSNATVTLNVVSNQGTTLTISGSVNDCNGDPVLNGTVLLSNSNNQYYTFAQVNNGIYQFDIVHCSAVDSLNVTAWENANSTAVYNSSILITGDNILVPAIALSCPIALNPYDGIYEANGTFVYDGNTDLTGYYPKIYYLVTNTASSVTIKEEISPGLLVPTYTFIAIGASEPSHYVQFGEQLFFNASNQITEVRNYYGDPTNLPTSNGDPSLGTGAPYYASTFSKYLVVDPSGVNNFDPVTHSIKVKYKVLRTVDPAFLQTIDETLTYIGPR